MSVGPSNWLQQARCIGNRAGHRTGVVETPAEREDAGPADSPIGGFEPDNTAQRCGDTDRASGVTSHRAVHQVSGQRSPGAGARSTGKSLRVPGIAGCAVHLHAAGREFDCIKFADADGARLA